ncbi:putative dual specificity mitogen-activated protein kinase kinase 1 [Coleophoma crateriformis]|uniref:Putative dual specificity mitogen-activated protein kinase kinase 1 n=1 Tax=Coleophoma crateriformis TaxID=565419 RepID=A0A3D8SYB8_9HELO|nr:putative dual specificity mitogen-activated protein kinase kinase 1 [Coleophoma crateriformis]
MSDAFTARTLKRKNVKGLALNAPAPRPVAPSESDVQVPGGLGNESNRQTAQLEIGIEYRLDLKREDLEVIKELGQGNGGTVSKVRHVVTGTIMARKVIHVEAKKEMRRRIVRELQIMYECNSEFIVNFYGAFLSESNDVIMCMEYMDVGALDRISQQFGPVRVDVLGKIAEATLGGLTYLYTKHHIMHRDIKPSNILVNSRGDIKLCDFGVSGELINSVADTFVGTSTYMAPERIQGQKYTVKSDVWSFGLSIMELAIGKFPFDASEHLSDGDVAPQGILDLLQQIVFEPAPKLPKSEAFPSILEDMIQKCLAKDPAERPTPQQLYEQEPFVQAAKRTPVDLREWAVGLIERDNRKSHLAPQLSPASKEALRPTDSPGTRPTNSPDYAHTPTSGDIPIGGADVRSAIASPQLAESRSPIKNGSSSLGRATGANYHPGLSRGQTTNSVPRLTTLNAPDNTTASGASSANAVSFNTSLPMRPAPPAGPLPAPPVPPKKDSTDLDVKKESRRQATFGNALYAAGGYSNSGNGPSPY